MSLLPFTEFDTMMDPFQSFGPLQTFDPFFGRYNIVPRSMRQSMNRMNQELGRLLSSVKEDDKSFQVMVDVSQFQPNEITVKTTDKNIIVHGMHEERNDQFGTVSREFRRRITIPQGVNPESVTSTMSPEGILTVMAPKMMLEGSKERVIPITMAPQAGSNAKPTPAVQGQ